MKSFTIKRSKWARGRKREMGGSQLLNKRGNMCCLGFYLKSCGLPEAVLDNAGVPEEVFNKIPEQAQWLLADNTFDSTESDNLIDVNDGKYFTLPYGDDGGPLGGFLSGTRGPNRIKIEEDIRELAVKELFAVQGIKVKFVD